VRQARQQSARQAGACGLGRRFERHIRWAPRGSARGRPASKRRGKPVGWVRDEQAKPLDVAQGWRAGSPEIGEAGGREAQAGPPANGEASAYGPRRCFEWHSGYTLRHTSTLP
jgi:hypothetical protein